MKIAKIKDHICLVRDLDTQAILATDITMVRKHEQKMADLEKEQNREIELKNIKNDIAEIKTLLVRLFEMRNING